MEELKNGKKRKSTSEGFTFVETMSVLAIGAILAAGTSVSASKLIEKAKENAARNQIQQYCTALQSYFLDCGEYPATEDGLSVLWENSGGISVSENWNGPYLEREPSADPWGTNFEYINTEDSTLPPEVPENLPFVLISYGADRKEGGEGNGKDICSWK